MTEHAASSLPEPNPEPVVAPPANSAPPPWWPAALDEAPPSKTGNSTKKPEQRLPWGGAPSLRPLRWREILAVVLLVVLCDVTISRGQGFAGLAALFLIAPGLMLWGSPRPRLRTAFWMVGCMLFALAGRMVWLGSVLGAVAGFVLLVAMALAIAGRRPYVLDVVACAAQTTVAGYLGLMDYQRSAGQLRSKRPTGYRLSVILPLVALAVFGALFILANPDLARSVQIGWHPVNAEGLLVLAPLTHCDDPIIREGIQALLAREGVSRDDATPHRQAHWTTFQLSDRLLASRLGSIREEWEPYVDATKREEAWRRFCEYVYQWY